MASEPANSAANWATAVMTRLNDLDFIRSTMARDTMAADFVREDRRRFVALPDADRDAYVQQAVLWHSIEDGSPSCSIDQVIAVRGDHCVAVSAQISYRNGTSTEFIAVIRTDKATRLAERVVTFDPDDVASALTELDRLHAGVAAGGGHPRAD